MNYKKYFETMGICLGIGLLSMLVTSFLLTILNYFNLVTGTFFTILNLLIPFLSLLIAGILLGKKSKSKGWLEGLKLSLGFIIIFTLIQLFFLEDPFRLTNILYDTILMMITIFGSMLGINMRANQK